MADNDEQAGAALVQAPGLGLGERLRSARKARALSVAKIAEELRLEESVVSALEEGRFEAVGAPVFVRGHLRRYAAVVGLSAESVLEAYRAAVPGSDAPPRLAQPRSYPEALPSGSWLWWVVGGAAVVALVIVLGSGGDDAVTAPAAGMALTEPSGMAPDPAPQDLAPEVSPAPPAPAGSAPSAAAEAAAPLSAAPAPAASPPAN